MTSPVLVNSNSGLNAARVVSSGNLVSEYDVGQAPLESTSPIDWSTLINSVDAQRNEAYLTNQFNAEQALLNREFNAAQAQLNRAFNAAEAQKARDYNSREAQLAREFNAQQAALNRSFQLTSAREAMDFEHNEAEYLRQWQELQNQKAMDYNTEMSNTAYQRAVKDLQAAGLNPILAYTNGAASTPSGVTSSGAFASGKQVSGSAASGSAASGSAASGSAASGSAASGVMADVRGYIRELTGAIYDIASSASKVLDSVLPG